MCAPCKTILNHIDDFVSQGANIHSAVRLGVESAMDDLTEETQNRLSQLDAKHIRARMKLDLEYFEEFARVLSEHAGVEF